MQLNKQNHESHLASKFRDRHEAGVILAHQVKKLNLAHPLVVALPRGGLPVAEPICKLLHTALEVIFVKKITLPRHPEFAIGAIAEDGDPEWQDVKTHAYNIEEQDLDHLAEIARKKISEQRAKWGAEHEIVFADKDVVLVDDGLATGATLFAAINFIKTKEPSSITVALPVSSHASLEKLRSMVDHVICLQVPHRFFSVSQAYEDFTQTTDDEVFRILKKVGKKFVRLSPVAEELKKVTKVLQTETDADELINQMAQARVVFLGESSHGTEEFYRIRRLISQKLIQDHGFKFIAVEGDWPDCWKLNDYIVHGKGGSARKIMESFNRWPTWMWANEQTEKLIEWMANNGGSFYGLDIYSIFESLDVLRTFVKESLTGEISDELLKAYGCFDPFERDEKSYARSLHQMPSGCREEVVSSLRKLLRLRLEETTAGAPQLFNAQQNALIVANAEKYYRALIEMGDQSWNIRDEHMMDTLDGLLRFHGENAKAIVWAHNTHIGDYHATDMLKAGYINIGGLAREKYGLKNIHLCGFGTGRGTVLAGQSWGADPEIMKLKRAKLNSIEDELSKVSTVLGSQQIISLLDPVKSPLLIPKVGHRAVGVVYNPEYEKGGQNYVPTSFANRYDSFIYIDSTKAIKTFRNYSSTKKLPETWPSGI